MLFPAIWLDMFIETRVRRSEARSIGTRNIQLLTGLHWSIDAKEIERRNLDFDGLTHTLTVLGNEVAWDHVAITMLIDIQEKLVAVHRRYCYDYTCVTDSSKRDRLIPTPDSVEGKLRNSKDLLFGLKLKVQFTSEQVKLQLQAVSVKGF